MYQQMQDNQLEFTKVDGLSRYDYGLLRSRGIAHLFDTMRYEQACLTRMTDVAKLIMLYEAKTLVVSIVEIMVASLATSAKKFWTYDRLLSSMSLDLLDAEQVVNGGSNLTTFKIKPKLTWRSDFTLRNADFPKIIKTMYANKAFPCNEWDSHKIESLAFSFATLPEVRLTTYTNVQKEWFIP